MSGHRPGDLFIFGHKQVFESAIVAGNKILAADDARICKIASRTSETIAADEFNPFAELLFKNLS
jgi:hypothetical protein